MKRRDMRTPLVAVLLSGFFAMSAQLGSAQETPGADVPLADEEAAVVQTPNGTLVGNATETGRQFLGVPFAEAPVGDLRWMSPQPIDAVRETRIAQDFGADCVQPVDGWNFNPSPGDEMKGSEDCLFLNIYTPRATLEDLPVMVWIHGGGFVTGSGREYDGHILAETQDVIVVTINYRLGALGFLSHPALGDAAGNFGLLDQQMALRWVERNIASFGGDPENVTVLGESAGGVSVCAHLAVPGSAGLFDRAIIQSGPCFAAPRSSADEKGVSYAENADCPPTGPEALACLRGMPASLVAAVSPGESGAGDTPWTLVNETPVLPAASVYAEGRINHVPLINGSNLDEGRLFALAALPLLEDRESYEANVRTQFPDNAERVLAEYPAEAYETPALAYSAYMTDFMFACPARETNMSLSAHMPVYAYEFRDRTGRYFVDAPPELGDLGAHHAKEIQFIFQTPSFFSGPADLTDEQMELSQQMMQAWTSFARDGSPEVIDGVDWEAMQPNAPFIYGFDTSANSMVRGFSEAHNCDFWTTQ